ncbi:hypothetical protein [Sorangium sp. So ce426]|uniref:hypothetical protein n=1 Tax=unclassified Sorangium TaxID=2621164 RepID=UPI003F5C51CD
MSAIPPISVMGPAEDPVLRGIVERCPRIVQVASLDALALHLERRAAAEGPTTLDLNGHSTPHNLLRFAGVVVDLFQPEVAAFFSGLSESGVLDRLHVSGVRLLGCHTALGPVAQRTLRRLSRTLRRPVWGTVTGLLKSHYDAEGLNPAFRRLLVEAAGSPVQAASAAGIRMH